MIKKFADHQKEIAYLMGAILLALVIIVYLFILVHLLAQKANSVFGDTAPPSVEARYNFKEFHALFPDTAPAGTVTSTPSVASSSATSTH